MNMWVTSPLFAKLSSQLQSRQDSLPEFKDSPPSIAASNPLSSQAPALGHSQTCTIHSSSRSPDTSCLDIPPFSDFLVDPTFFTNGVGVCIRRSDGRLYTIKKLLQTPRVWAELDILVKIKEARIPFSPLLHWTFEKDHHIYAIMVCISLSFFIRAYLIG